MHKGYLALVLHAHLPFVRHPEEDYFLEENWLFEAITETYIPLLEVFDNLYNDSVGFKVTMSITPPLACMLKDPLLQERYLRHINKLIELSEKELQRTQYDSLYHGLAAKYNHKFERAKQIFSEKYKNDLTLGFKYFQDKGCLEIIASCATHGFLPNLRVNESSVKAQVEIGINNYIKTFGKKPKGFWLPECGYYPRVDEFLKNAGIKYFFIDSHGIMHADPVPRYGVYAPLYCPSGVAAFGRDWESSKQVWSASEGYPGDVDYREYYRDIGFELEYDYIKPYIHPMGLRVNTGIKYWRITGKTEYKEVYRPDWAREKAAQHAGNFMFNREKQIEHLSYHLDRKPIIISPYDAELFGHWWYEGPMWLEFLARKMFYDQQTIKMITPSEYLEEYPTNQMSMPSQSSWGYKGYSEFWLEGCNDWIYKHMHVAGERMATLANKYKECLNGNPKHKIIKRALNQAARELLLAESSDWPFIMKTGTMVPYANKRINNHIGRFNQLFEEINSGNINKDWLTEVEKRDNIFEKVNLAEFYLSKPLHEKENIKENNRKKSCDC